MSKDDNASGTAAQDSTAELDGPALVRGWEALENAPPLRLATRVTWAARTDIGRVRENNEDKYDFFLPDSSRELALRGRLWAVADGMGGHSAGQIASEAALKTLVRSYFNPSSQDAETALKTAITDANALIHQAAQRMGSGQSGMGTTLVAVVLREDQFLVAHVGDSRVYRYRESEGFTQLTTDHSWVEEQVQRGSMTREKAETSPYRNMITRSVGVEDTVKPDVSTHTAKPGDLFLLCSDGLSGLLSDDALLAHIKRTPNPARLALDLIDAANDAGGRDNITALLIRVDGVDEL